MVKFRKDRLRVEVEGGIKEVTESKLLKKDQGDEESEIKMDTEEKKMRSVQVDVKVS